MYKFELTDFLGLKEMILVLLKSLEYRQQKRLAFLQTLLKLWEIGVEPTTFPISSGR
jgi:hypothetical protein